MSEMTTKVNGTTTEAAIDMLEVKKWFMDGIMIDTIEDEPVNQLIFIYAKTNNEDVQVAENVSVFKKEPSQKECKEILILLAEEVQEQLTREHTFLVTGRLLEAFWILSQDTREFKPANLKVEVCVDIISSCSVEDGAYEIMQKLDKLI